MLSVIVLTLNESRHITACLDSVRGLADELVVFDSYSMDATPALAREAGAVVYQRTFDNYPCQRNAALDAARGDWVLFIDADERADADLASQVRDAVVRAGQQQDGPVLFWIPRKNYIWGKWIRHTGWSPDYQPRLMYKAKVRFDVSRPVHELVIARGSEDYLHAPLTHFNYETLGQFRAKQLGYTRFEAQMLFEQGIRSRRRSRIGQPLREFFRRYVVLRGYQDGGHGLLLSILMAYYAYVRQKMLAELWSAKA